jgi:phosphatidylserine/phosphatidylglycerophosphate/cardiolipin synthase-like enzyme
MHHKVIVLDGQSVVTGSYNFSNNAETRNDENLLVIESPEIASQYEAEFRRVFEMAQPKGQSGPQLRFDLATFLSERYN